MSNPFTFKLVENLGIPLENFRRVKKLVQDLKTGDSYAKAGVVGNKAGERSEGGLTNALLAAYMEFGTPNAPYPAPARSFINQPFEKNKGKYKRALAQMLPKVLEGTITVKRALGIVGLAAASDMRQAIRDHIPPPNAEATIAAKGSSTPLIGDSGQLLRSVTHLVVIKGSDDGK